MVPTFPALRVGITYLPLPLGSALTLLFILERMIACRRPAGPWFSSTTIKPTSLLI